MFSTYTYNPGHFIFVNNNMVNYGSCTNIFYTNWSNQPQYVDQWDYNNYWIGNGQFNLNGASTKTVAGFSALLGSNFDANSTTMDPHIIYQDSIAKPSQWAGLLCPMADSVRTDIMGVQRSTMTYKGCYTETFNLDAALLDFVEPSFESVLAGTSVPVKVKMMNVGNDSIQTLTIRWTVDGVAQPVVNLTKLDLGSYDSKEITLGSFIPSGTQNGTTIVAW